MNDSQLMEQFVGSRDSVAFRDLVARHSPGVLRVCRRFVHDPHAAEDAMQATFMILVQRAPSIRDPEQLDRWLAGVARRVADRARRRELRRTEREHRWAESRPEAKIEGDGSLHLEVRRAVREELNRLADADRQPLTLCYLDGLTHEEAARRIGCPVGTIKARLVRARRRLRDRLDRRGVALGLGLLLFLLRRPASASATEPLAESTVEIMTLTAAGQADQVQRWYPRVARLAEVETMTGQWLTRGSLLALAAILALIGVGSVAIAAHHTRNDTEARNAAARLAKLLDVNCQVQP